MGAAREDGAAMRNLRETGSGRRLRAPLRGRLRDAVVRVQVVPCRAWRCLVPRVARRQRACAAAGPPRRPAAQPLSLSSPSVPGLLLVPSRGPSPSPTASVLSPLDATHAGSAQTQHAALAPSATRLDSSAAAIAPPQRCSSARMQVHLTDAAARRRRRCTLLLLPRDANQRRRRLTSRHDTSPRPFAVSRLCPSAAAPQHRSTPTRNVYREIDGPSGES